MKAVKLTHWRRWQCGELCYDRAVRGITNASVAFPVSSPRVAAFARVSNTRFLAPLTLSLVLSFSFSLSLSPLSSLLLPVLQPDVERLRKEFSTRVRLLERVSDASLVGCSLDRHCRWRVSMRED